jgi:hypothetical protein
VNRLLCLIPLLVGCAAKAPPPHPPHAEPAPVAAAPSAAPPSVSAAPTPSQPEQAAVFKDCGELACKAFTDPGAAFDFVLREAPRVLAVGEAHAQGAGPKLASSTRRFMDGLLPRLAPRASDLVIELWVGSGACGKVEQKVQKQQAEVTAPQAATNQNEFLELGHRAKALGIMPHALVPSCDQYQKIAGAGASDIAEMLTMIKSVTARDVQELLSKRPADRLIVAYGGAMHNDLVPRPGREDFSFGPLLEQATKGGYVELDLVIPEQIKDTEAWRALPWYPHYSASKAGTDTYLFSWAPHAYALIFPRSPESEVP